jgi:uncharacterized protein (DUF1501 family)
MQRRSFLTRAGALAALSALGEFRPRDSRASTTEDYKALVCIFLYGGNDSNNMIVPIDAAGYANYAQLRSTLALPLDQLLPLAGNRGAPQYGLHPSLPGMQALYKTRNLAVVANVGTLVEPLTKAQYLSPDTVKPDNLFSHIDQQQQWEASISDTPSLTTGWGGRLTDQLTSFNAASSLPPMISTGGNNLFVTAAASQALVIPASGPFILGGFSSGSADVVRRAALVQLLGIDQRDGLTRAGQNIMTDALSASALLNPILTAPDPALQSYFAGLTSNFALQLLAIAKVIQARAELGSRRQVFLATLGSFDTHTDQLFRQQTLFAELDPALNAFCAAMAGIGAGDDVTSFTLSDFSRTLLPNTGGGTDHAWGSHQIVAGGAVRGGQIYGTMPTLALGGPDDVGNEGRWIPTIAVDQYAATLSSWFGASPAELAVVLPNLGAFSPGTLGFV